MSCYLQSRQCKKFHRLCKCELKCLCIIHLGKQRHISLLMYSKISFHCKRGTVKLKDQNKQRMTNHSLGKQGVELILGIDQYCMYSHRKLLQLKNTKEVSKSGTRYCFLQSRQCKKFHKLCKFCLEYFHKIHLDIQPHTKWLQSRNIANLYKINSQLLLVQSMKHMLKYNFCKVELESETYINPNCKNLHSSSMRFDNTFIIFFLCSFALAKIILILLFKLFFHYSNNDSERNVFDALMQNSKSNSDIQVNKNHFSCFRKRSFLHNL